MGPGFHAKAPRKPEGAKKSESPAGITEPAELSAKIRTWFNVLRDIGIQSCDYLLEAS
jgi:hypothetical protein